MIGGVQRGPGRNWIGSIVVIVGGCGGAPDANPHVTGVVRLDAAPLETGTILFQPEDRSVAPQMAQIEGGEFACRLTPGRYRVEIQASRTVDGKSGKYGEPIYESIVPRRYNEESTLTADVIADGPNELIYELESA